MKTLIKELKSWGVIFGIFLILYVTGLHTEVAAIAQRAILYTGIMDVDTPADDKALEKFDYELNVITSNDQIMSLNELKGKVIFLNIWASWCPPCIAEMPSIQELYESVTDENIVFVMLSVDKTRTKATEFINKKGFTFPTFTPANTLTAQLNVGSIPTTFVISKSGEVVLKEVGMANYNRKKFKAFLQNLANE